MNERNCGFCEACARGEYDKCATRAAELPPATVYVLYTFDRWCHEFVYQTMFLVESGRCFNRKGRKIYSYESWVETSWYDWEETV